MSIQTFFKYHVLAMTYLGMVIFLTPHIVSANYTFNGHTFASYSEMKIYITEYFEVWRELHGYSQTTTSTHSSVDTTVTSSKLIIDTKTVRDEDYDSAVLVGTIDFKRSDRVKIWFDYGTHASSLTERSNTQVLYEEDDWRQFDQKISNLSPLTTYYYRACGINEDGAVSCGKTRSFSTGVDTVSDNALIKVQTWYASTIEENRATLVASVHFRKEAYAYVWFEYGEDEDSLDDTSKGTLVYAKNGSNFSDTIRGLDSEKQYFYRAIAEDAQGVKSYGDIMSFTTAQDVLNEKPKISVFWNTPTTAESAEVTASVDMNDFRNGKVFLVYGEDTTKIYSIASKYDSFGSIREYGEDLQKVLLDSDLDKDDEYTFTIHNLEPKTQYYYTIGVEYEDENDDTVLLLAYTYSFTTRTK